MQFLVFDQTIYPHKVDCWLESCHSIFVSVHILILSHSSAFQEARSA